MPGGRPREREDLKRGSERCAEEQPPDEMRRDGAYCTSALAPSPPTAKPHKEPAFVKTGARLLPSGCRSISAAPRALVARPTATPCTARATNSCATPCAVRNRPQTTALTKSAALITLRRPRWSDTDPKIRR